MNKKIILYGLITILIIGLLITQYFTGFLTPNKSEEYIKIGYISALSGDAGIWGQSLQKGFDYAVEEINNNGGINGKLIKAVYEDDQCDPKLGITAYNKLIELQDVDIITGSVCSSVALSVAPITQENRILFIASGATQEEVVKQGDLIFRVFPPNSYETTQLINYSIDNLNTKKIGLMYIYDEPTGKIIENKIKEIANSKNIEIPIIETFSKNEIDYKTSVTKIISKDTDSVYILAFSDNIALIINELKKQNYKGKILCYGPAILSEGVIDQINDKTNIYYPEPITEKKTDFWDNYKQKTGEDADIFIAGGYDSMKLIEMGLRECGEDNECIKNKLLSLENYDITRGTISFNENGDIEGMKYEIKELN